MHITDVMNDRAGSILVSVILGLGLAAVFRRVCKGDRCVVVKSPSMQDLQQYYYKIESECYKYQPYSVACPGAAATSSKTPASLSSSSTQKSGSPP